MTTRASRQCDTGIPPIRNPSVARKFLNRWYRWRLRRAEQRELAYRHTPEARFNRLLSTATEIARINPHGLVDLVRAILRPLQSERILHVAEYGFSNAGSLSFGHLFGPSISTRMWLADGSALRGTKLAPDDYQLNLAMDPVLPWPWQSERYASALATIGSRKWLATPVHGIARSQGKWQQRGNHSVELWLPWGIGFVASGNHSITAGILAGEGLIVPDDVYDMAYLLDEVRCDGRFYRDVSTGERLHEMGDPRYGAVFEIGRLLIQHGIRPAFAPV